MLRQRVKLKLAVMESPPIKGFSYPFLRLLVDEIRRREKADTLFVEHDTSNNRHRVSEASRVILEYIKTQVESIDVSFDSFDGIEKDRIDALITASEELLAIFTPTTEEYLESQRTPEKP
jgi:hypothetical protein